MILSEDRQNHLAHLATDKVWGADIADFSDDDIALRAAKAGIAAFVKEDSEIDKKAREKVSTLKRNVMEGTREWDILYKKYYEEEKGRHGN
jgi:hypothetical protein